MQRRRVSMTAMAGRLRGGCVVKVEVSAGSFAGVWLPAKLRTETHLHGRRHRLGGMRSTATARTTGTVAARRQDVKQRTHAAFPSSRVRAEWKLLRSGSAAASEASLADGVAGVLAFH